jgi:aryl-alcohol dehydrogenase-like predicted oxidoreductase
MEYRHFGKTDLKVSAIGFGCWEIGGTYGRIDESEFERAVAQAIDSGITCFDTAEAYGNRFSAFWPAPALAGQSLALRKLCDARSNRRSRASA